MLGDLVAGAISATVVSCAVPGVAWRFIFHFDVLGYPRIQITGWRNGFVAHIDIAWDVTNAVGSSEKAETPARSEVRGRPINGSSACVVVKEQRGWPIAPR